MIKHSALYEKLQKQYLQNWTICSEQFPVSGKRFSYFEKRIWEMKFDRFLQVIKKEANNEHPDKNRLLQQAQSFFREALNYSNEHLHFIFSDDMLCATKSFIQKAWEFDSNLGNEELFQALRNVWIMLGLQSFFGKKIQITPSFLAYSLLYPYTDNLIDDASISKIEKLEFSERFAARLSGKQVHAQSVLEEKIYDLVKMIEGEYERQEFPQVYESLLTIHEAQTQSLTLVNNKELISDTECMKICIEKGASSVIADGYLVLGDLSAKQFHFLFEYGAYLQILDDLQDARQDYLDDIKTCFSSNLPYGDLDKMLCKTYSLGKKFHQTLQDLYPNEIAFQGLIKRSFGLLFIASVFENKDDFSSEFIQKIEKHAPFRFSFLQEHQKELKPFKDLMMQKMEEYRDKEFVKI